MSLKDRLERDVANIFYRESEFASYHDFDGEKVLCIIDAEEALRQRNQNAVFREWDAGSVDLVVRVPTAYLSFYPVEGSQILFDGVQKRIESVQDNQGELIILLKSSEARVIT